jgi:purine-binding chemotaxis protein CheW
MLYIATFIIDNQQFAFNLTSIERVISAVEITPLPNMTHHIMGLINMHGQMISVFNLRVILGLSNRDIDPEDQFMICKTRDKTVALWVDNVQEIIFFEDLKFESIPDNFPQMASIDRVIKIKGRITLMYDIDKLLPFEEFLAAKV